MALTHKEGSKTNRTRELWREISLTLQFCLGLTQSQSRNVGEFCFLISHAVGEGAEECGTDLAKLVDDSTT